MSEQKKAVLLVGSPKGLKSTSAALGVYSFSKMDDQCFDKTIFMASDILKPDSSAILLSAIEEADILVFAFPLYVDALPYPVVRLMENIAERRKEARRRRTTRMLAIVNCGFPEARHCDTALAICRRFAEETAIEWAGGLALGGGGAIDGHPLEKRGALVKRVKRSLDLASEALVNGTPVPRQAPQLMSKPLMPAWLYLWIAEFGGKRESSRNGVAHLVNRRPYEI
jgi:hypothetical protein